MAKSKRKKSKRTSKINKPSKRTDNCSLDGLMTALRAEPDDLEAAVALCEYYLNNGSEQKIAEVLSKFNQLEYTGADLLKKRFASLYALGLAHSRRFGEADEVARKILTDNPSDLDALFVITYTHLSLREFKKAGQAAKQFIESFNGTHVSAYCSTKAHLSQVWNFLGSSQQEQGEIAQAIESFTQALKADKGNHLPYLNIASLYTRQNETEKAIVIVKKGIKNCRQIEELRLVEKSQQRTATISACMIVKDEEELLPDCLASIRDWVDEIIVVDTGSSDRTIEIAESFGAIIIEQPWEGDFSKHRNYSLDQATSDWLFVIDADERIRQEDVGTILQHVNTDENPILAISVLNVGGAHGEEVTSLSSVRFFKRELALKYDGIVHNQLTIDPDVPVLKIPVSLIHLGYGLSPEKMEAKAQRTIGLLEQQLKENPSNAFAWYNLAQVLIGMDFVRHPENPIRIISAAEEALKLTSHDSGTRGERNIHLMALQQLALTHFISGDLEETEEYAERALRINPEYLDPILLMGNLNIRKNNFVDAEKYYQEYLTQQKVQEQLPPADDLILLHPRSRYRAQYGLGIIAQMRGDIQTALNYFQMSQQVAPEYLDVNARIGCIYLQSDNKEQAAVAFQRQLKSDPSNRTAIIGSCCLTIQNQKTKEVDEIIRRVVASEQVASDELLMYAKMFEQSGSTEYVELCLDRLILQPDHSIEQLATAAELYLSSGIADKSAQAYQKVIELQGESPELLNDLAGCFYKSEDYEKAEEFYLKAIDCENEIPISYRNLGLTRTRLEKPKEAIEALEKYLDLESEDNDIRHLLGELQFKTGDVPSAIKRFEEILQSNPNDVLTLFRLSECYHAMGHRDSAIMGYRRVLNAEPDFQPAHQRLAELLQPVDQL